jgi:pyrroline-5-carboxylate reductase
MARSLAGGLLHNGWESHQLLMSDPLPGQRQGAEQALGVSVQADNKAVAKAADILILAVKPQALAEVASELAPAIAARKPLVISLAAGVRMADLERWLGADVPIVRVMPNTPALIGSGASGLFANTRVTESQRDQAESIVRAVGVTVWVGDEHLMDVITALSGSGPAYFFLVMEALEGAAINAGLDPAQARLLTLETAYGAAKMALEGADEPHLLRQRVTSPGGTTEAAVKALEDGGLRRLFDDAVRAAVRRAGELGDLFGKNA